MITITIETDNDAFSRGHKRHELARILRELAENIKLTGRVDYNLRDVNGNKVGTCTEAD